jgi:hypothetical protein
MHTRIAAAFLVACAPCASADVVELSPDLYLVIRMSRVEDAVAIKVGAIDEANKFAASSGMVAAPVTGRLTSLGPLLKEYEYQFRLMSRADALEAKPTLADAVISIAGSDSCTPGAGRAVTAAVPALFSLQALRERGVLVTNEAEAKAEEAKKTEPPATPEDAPPVPAPVAPDPTSPRPPQAPAQQSTQ